MLYRIEYPYWYIDDDLVIGKYVQVVNSSITLAHIGTPTSQSRKHYCYIMSCFVVYDIYTCILRGNCDCSCGTSSSSEGMKKKTRDDRISYPEPYRR